MPLLRKKAFLEGNTCLTKGWFIRSGISDSLTYAEQFRMDEGTIIGRMARLLYPERILIDEGSNDRNQEKTQKLIADQDNITLFEATFVYQAAITRTDILQRVDGEWHLIEVKSSSKVDDELIDDLSYTTLILELCGIKPVTMSLMLVSKGYRLGMDNSDFFVTVDCTDDVVKKLPDFRSKLVTIMQTTGMEIQPQPTFIYPCKKCQYFSDYCLGQNINNPIFQIPNIRFKKFSSLTSDGVFEINQIPSDFKLTELQKIVWAAVKDQTPWLNLKALKHELGKIVYSAYYLDFETVSTAVPLYENIAPYAEIITQYSLHVYSSLDNEQGYSMYLADHTKDDRRQLALKLINDISDKGSVIVYHAGAEKKYIKNLANSCPDLAEPLNAIIDRIVDLEVIVKGGYYHPDFHGSYSIKVVLPVLVPEMSYDKLEIGQGSDASAIFANLARGKYTVEEATEIRRNLLEYCKQDTLAMVKIHERLVALIQ